MNQTDAKLLKYLCLPILLVLLVLWILSGLFQTGQPDAELSRTVREVVREALAVQRTAHHSGLAGSIVRIVALVSGVLGPLVVAYLVHRSRAHSEVTADEVLEVLERHGLIDLDGKNRLMESKGDRRLLGDAKDGQDRSESGDG
jgi:hypothetical protein